MSTLCLRRQALLEMSRLQFDKVKVLTQEWRFSKNIRWKRRHLNAVGEQVACLSLSGVI